MENATKALEIAGSVLIALMIIGLLTYGYTQLTSVKKTEHQVEVEEQAVDFNKAYESYDQKVIYGSQLFALANKMENYNEKEANAKGYAKMELSVKITTNPGTNPSYFHKTTYSLEEIIEQQKKLTDEITSLGNDKNGTNKTISYWANSSSELNTRFNNSTSPTLEEMKSKIKEYNKLVSEQTDMARKQFYCETKYDDKNTGRITTIKCTEK